MLAKVAEITDLSFIDATKQWCPHRTGDYAADCALGHRYADEMVTFMRMKHCTHAFSHVIKSISAQGMVGGVEIGFCSRIGIHLIGIPAQFA